MNIDNNFTNNNKENHAIINGTIKTIVYYNIENDFTVAKIISEEIGKEFTAVGYLGGVQPGENLQLIGKWIVDPKFGEQLKIDKFRVILPSTEKGIINFLSSGLIHGIGKSYAKRIVTTFGTDTLQIISEHPERLNEVKGLGKKRIDGLIKSWKELYAVRDIMMFLQNFDISAAFASKIFQNYGFDSIERVKSNPYRLASDISGIGFLSADKIAKSMGIHNDSDLRVEAGIIYVLDELTKSGHIYIPETILIESAQKILETNKELIISNINTLIEKELIIKSTDINDISIIYPSSLYYAENGVVSHIERIKNTELKFIIQNPEQELLNISSSHLIFSAEQKKAVLLALQKKIIVITGGPGTGKTTIIKNLVDIFLKYNLQISLTAPTGRAAKRLAESTCFEAKTIHRLLEFNPRENGFTKDEHNQLPADIIIVDEASMIDILLMYHLLNATSSKAVLIIVGDVDQLPSVGPGKILQDIIDSNKITSIKLETIFRQEKGSNIISNAHKINKGEKIQIKNEENDNFFFIKKDDPKQIPQIIQSLIAKRIPSKFGLDPFREIQILTPMYKTDNGVNNLNKIIQETLNPNPKISVRRHLNIALNDKVMQTSNNYDKDIFNGDIGFIKHIDESDQKVIISFDEKEVEFNYSELDDIVLAYAITIHKSQGSEYDCVIIPVTTAHYTMLQRNLIYTAITRGKKLVILVGSLKALNIAINNDKIQLRYSKLKTKLQNSL